jgi:ABC-type uncharacterized transport system substrate-binding protein
VGPKRLELVRELLPTATIIAVLVNPTNPNAQAQSRDLQAAAPALGVQLHVLHASTEGELDTAFAGLLQRRAGALIIATDSFMIIQIKRLAALATRYAVPTVFQFREFAAAGGLMSYGGSIADANRLAGIYTGRVLKVRSPPTCRCSNPPKSNCLSISGPRRRSASRSHQRYSPAPTR